MKAIMEIAALTLMLAAAGVGLILADDISLTVYNSNLGVVRETRNLTFQQGNGRIAFTDVASQIDPTSVSFELVDPKLAVAILEQNYAYDLVSPDKIYGKYIDQEIEIVTEKGEVFSGRLLSFAGGYLVIEQKDGRIFSILQGVVRNVAFPSLPEGLITRPTLFWLYNSNFAGSADALVSYQTTGIDWQAEYVGVLGDDEKTMELTGWVSIDNHSGKTYKDAKLKVVAGDISRVRPQPIYRTDMLEKAMAAPQAAGFEEKPFFEYHLYTLPRPATIADNEIKQVTMFEPTRATVQKEYQYQAEPGQTDVTVYLKTTNTKEVGLGMPLPAGRVRIFKADSDGSMILLGEDRIDHTPRNEEVKLTVGKAFDVVGKTTTVAQRRITDQVNETDFSVEVRNQKDKPVTVKVTKTLGTYWEITKTSLDFVKKSASEVEWQVDVPAEGKAVIDFTVRYTH
jgi:hypothetical protein